MDVFLTFDVEVWCNGWDRLDERFPAAFRRYVYGRSSKGDFALPRIFDTLDRHGLKAVFFIEPMFAGRFGVEHLAVIVEMVRDAGQEVQLHLHPEWTDELRPPLLAGQRGKRQHLTHYNAEEQTQLVRFALQTLRAAGALDVTAFRAGSFAANHDTFAALKANAIRRDSSANATVGISVPDLRTRLPLYRASLFEGVAEYPLTVFLDGFGQPRHAQIGACSADELAAAMDKAQSLGWQHFVILGHNFELLRPGSAEPDRIVVNRFEALCRYLRERRADAPTRTFSEIGSQPIAPASEASLPRVPVPATLRRHAEQLWRNWVPNP